MAELLLASKCCGQCLTTKGRIVPGRRAAEIVRSCKRSGTHFQCHKGSMVGLNIHCRGVHDAIGGSQAHTFAVRLGIPVREVDPAALRTRLMEGEGEK